MRRSDFGSEFLPEHQIVCLSHIGSTSVETIWAKPIVDIMLRFLKNRYGGNERLTHMAICLCQSQRSEVLIRGYTPRFLQSVFHLHLRYAGDHDELYFRDYLQEHPRCSYRPEQLKLSLWKQYEHNRDAYTDLRRFFIKKYTKEAKSFIV